MDTIFNKTDLNYPVMAEWGKKRNKKNQSVFILSTFRGQIFGVHPADAWKVFWYLRGALEALNGGKPPILTHTAGLSKHAAVFFHLCHSGVVNVPVQRVPEQKKESSLFQIRLG